MSDFKSYQDLQRRLEKTLLEKEVSLDAAMMALQTMVSNVADEHNISFLRLIESQVAVYKGRKKVRDS